MQAEEQRGGPFQGRNGARGGEGGSSGGGGGGGAGERGGGIGDDGLQLLLRRLEEVEARLSSAMGDAYTALADQMEQQKMRIDLLANRGKRKISDFSWCLLFALIQQGKERGTSLVPFFFHLPAMTRRRRALQGCTGGPARRPTGLRLKSPLPRQALLGMRTGESQ